MGDYETVKVDLSQKQINTMRKAHSEEKAINIRLTAEKLSGNHPLLVTSTQKQKIEKAKKEGHGVQLAMSVSLLKANFSKKGGFIGQLFNAVGEAGSAMQGTYQGMLDNIKAQRERGFQKRIMTGKYDRKRARNERAIQRKNDANLAKRFNYVKKEFVKERGLNWDDDRIWQYVLTGQGMSGAGFTDWIKKIADGASKGAEFAKRHQLVSKVNQLAEIAGITDKLNEKTKGLYSKGVNAAKNRGYGIQIHGGENSVAGGRYVIAEKPEARVLKGPSSLRGKMANRTPAFLREKQRLREQMKQTGTIDPRYVNKGQGIRIHGEGSKKKRS